MRPPVPDIAAPDFPPDIPWVNAKKVRVELLLKAGPLLVHFWDFAQLNSLRTLPYLRRWQERYREAGLRVVGVHSPRYPFTAAEDAVRAAVERLEIAHPVAVDSDFRVWQDYGTEGWPALFLWAPSGVLDWFHFGEGEYRATEEAIQSLLTEGNQDYEAPDPLPAMRPSDAPGARVLRPTAEVFPGGSAEQPWQAGEKGLGLELNYAGAGAYAAIEGAGVLHIEVDGHAHELHTQPPGLYELAEHGGRHEEHSLRLVPADGQRIYSLSFAAGVLPGGAEEEYSVR